MFAKLAAIKKLDWVGIQLYALLGGVAVGAVYAALHFGWFRNPWELAVFLVVCVCFLAIGLPTQTAPQRPPPTRDAWDGGFQDMDSASHNMAKKDH